MRSTAALALVAALLGGSVARADDDVANFYKGRQVMLLVGSGAGGTYDLSARALARHIGSHIPGNPSVVVQNVPGAGGLTLANQIYNISPRDGSVFALTNNGVPTAPYLSPDQTHFDPRRLSWLGSSNRESEIVFLWHAAPVDSMEDLFRKEVIVGGVAPGTATVDYPLVANVILGTKFKVISGYASTPPIDLAMERGEVMGDAGLGWTTAKAEDAQLIAEKKVKIVAQYGFQKAPDLPDVPLFGFGKTDSDRQVLALLYARQDYGRPFFAPPDVPKARLDALRAAFDATVKDLAFLADAKQMKWDIDPVEAAELVQLTDRLAATPPEVAARLRNILNAKVETK